MAQAVKNLPAMWETQAQSLGQEHALEKEMATCSSIRAWEIPWTEEPVGSQKESDTTERVTLFTLTFHRRHSQQDRAAVCMRRSVEEGISTVTPRALTLVDWVEDSGVCRVGYIQYST